MAMINPGGMNPLTMNLAGWYSNFQSNMAQGLNNLQHGGTPGMGLNATNIPPQPPQQAYTDLQNLQSQHQADQSNFLNQLGTIFNNAKTSFFSQNHYVLNAQGQVQTDANGNPVVENGAENATEQTARFDFEQKQTQAIQQEQDKENQELATAMQNVQAAANDPHNANAQAQQQIMNQEAQLTSIATNLGVRQKFQTMTVGCEYIPNIGTMVQNGAQMYQNLCNADTQAENSSPAAQAINGYNNAIAKFAQEQQQKMAQMMSNLGSQMKGMLGNITIP